MTQQFVHNVRPGATATRPPTIDSRHLAAPGVPARATNALAGPEFERAARGFMALVEMYATNIAASGTAGPGVTVEDLKQLPLARLQQLALALPVAQPTPKQGQTLGLFLRQPLQANRGAQSDGFDTYDLNNPMGTLPD